MAHDSQVGARAPRLNPFVFPSETNLRFALLIVTVLGVSMYLTQILTMGIPFISQKWSNTQDSCSYEVYGQSAKDLSNPAVLSALDLNQVSRFLECMSSAQGEKAAWIVGGVMSLLALAAIIYWTFPIWKIRHDCLTPLSIDDAPDVVAYLTALCQETGLSRRPTFLWNPLNPISSGVAFGRWGQYYVALTGGLVTQWYTDRPVFRAILLHELAHLKNSDVDKTYFTMAVWQAFLVATFLPFVVAAVLGNALRLSFGTIWSVTMLAGLVYLSRNSVLRARELYADARAAVWDSPDGALGRVLAALPNQHGQRWRSALQVHPSPSERRQTLENPDRLFRLSFWIAIGTGIALQIVLPGVMLWMELVSQLSSFEVKNMVSGLIFAPLVVGIVGLGVWRASFAQLAQGRALAGTGHLAFGVVLGMMVGELLYNYRHVLPADPSGQWLPAITMIEPIVFKILWSGVLIAGLFLLLTWITAGVSGWLDVITSFRAARTCYVLCLTLAGGLSAVGFGVLLLLRNIFEISPIPLFSQVTFGFLITGLLHPYALLTSLSLWAFPLSAWFWRERAVVMTTASWAFLDPSPPALTLPRQASLRPGIALRLGFASGLLFCILLLIIRLGLRLSLPEATRETDQYKVMFYVGQIALAVVMQAGVAGTVAGWVKRLGWTHGLFAAFVAGCVMTTGALGLNLLFGGGIEPGFAWQTFSLIVNAGAWLALPIAVGVSAIAGWVRPSAC